MGRSLTWSLLFLTKRTMRKVEITKPRTENKREQPARTKAMKKRKMMKKKKKKKKKREEEEEEEREFNFTLSSGSSNDRADPNLSLSPFDDLFFKGRLMSIEPSSLIFNPSEPNSKQ
jgi:hypothetical protein